MRKEIKQFLEQKIFENGYVYLDYWSILHLLGFFILGTYYPNRWGLVIMGTIFFEILEVYMARRTSFFKESKKDTFTDIAINFLGYWSGQGGFL